MRPITFGMAVPPLLPPRMQIGLVRLAEWLGFDRVWFPDHLLYPDLMYCPDSWTVMAAAIPLTRRIVFGTAVSDPHRVHPAVLAQRLATLDQMSGGRLVLGLGSGEAMNLDPFGIEGQDRRVRKVREALEVLRGLLDSDEPFDYRGTFYRLERARLTVRPHGNRRIPVYVAALGPRMQRLTGRLGDGWMPVYLPASDYREYHREIDQAAVRAGRHPQDIEKVAVLCVALTRDPGPVLKLLRAHSLGILWPPVLERMGRAVSPPAEFAGCHYATVNPCDPESRARFEAHQKWMPEALLREFTVIGTVDQVREAIERYIEAGASHIKLMNATLDPTSSLILATEILPYFTGRAAHPGVRAAALAASALRKLHLIPALHPERTMQWLERQTGNK